MSLDHFNAAIAYDETDQGRVMAREVIRRPVTIDASVSPQDTPVWFKVDEVAIDRDFLRVLRYSSVNTFAASYLNTQGLNNSCLKSPASTAHSPSKHKDKHGFIISQCKHTEL